MKMCLLLELCRVCMVLVSGRLSGGPLRLDADHLLPFPSLKSLLIEKSSCSPIAQGSDVVS